MLAQPFPIDLSQPAAQVLLVIFFLIPGLNATWALERLAGRTALPPAERLFRAMAWSVLIYVSASPWLIRMGHRFASKALSPWEPIIGMSLLVFVAPIVLALLMLAARTNRHLRALLGRMTHLHPAPTAWDFAFGRGDAYFVRLELSGGRKLGGFFGQQSHAAAFPAEHDLFLEQAWLLDEEGLFVDPVRDTGGVWIRADEVRVVEFLMPERERGRSHGRITRGGSPEGQVHPAA